MQLLWIRLVRLVACLLAWIYMDVFYSSHRIAAGRKDVNSFVVACREAEDIHWRISLGFQKVVGFFEHRTCRVGAKRAGVGGVCRHAVGAANKRLYTKHAFAVCLIHESAPRKAATDRTRYGRTALGTIDTFDGMVTNILTNGETIL